MSDLTIDYTIESVVESASAFVLEPTKEWVEPKLILDKYKSKPLVFSTQAGEQVRTGWERWQAYVSNDAWTFFCVGRKTGIQYWSDYLPGEWVTLVRKDASERLLQFHNAKGDLIKTTRAKWFSGKGDSFFAYLDKGTAYLTADLGND